MKHRGVIKIFWGCCKAQALRDDEKEEKEKEEKEKVEDGEAGKITRNTGLHLRNVLSI